MNHEDIMLTEICQTQKDKYCMISLMEIPKVVKFIDKERRRAVARVGGRGSRELLFKGTESVGRRRKLRRSAL